MILYHASSVPVENPDVVHSRDFLDFGKGFYLTSIEEQAQRYALRFTRRNREAWINVYRLDMDPAQWRVMEFETYNREWLAFVSKCRNGGDDSNFHLVVGGIADDRVIQTLDRYFEGELSEEETLGLLRFERPNIQYCIRSQELINSCLTHISSQRIK